jgi:SNF2 family DNA or RNA helicase
LIHLEQHQYDRPVVVVERRGDTSPGAWARLQEAFARGIVGGSTDHIDVRVDVFLAESGAIRDVRRLYGEGIEFGPRITDQLRSLQNDRRQLESVSAVSAAVDEESLESELRSAGFVRKLKPFQIENLARIIALPHGADFSVPGAGKTSVALANYVLGKARGKIAQLLVIAPIAAFAAWKEDAGKCLTVPPIITVHTGQNSLIPHNTEILLTNYNRVAADYDRIREFIGRKSTQVVLDEAHRIKRGDLGVHGRAVLDLAYAARRRDVLTGTPAPQGAFDLVAIMRFLYPGQDRQILPAETYNERDGRDARVLRVTSDAMTRYFVRTPKSRLDLPPTQFNVLKEPMGPIQNAIYDALKGRYRGKLPLGTSERRRFDKLGQIVIYLLEAATNPMLLVAGSDKDDALGFAHPPLLIQGGEPIAELLQRYREYETPWKYDHVKSIVRESVARREKVIVWSTFVRNIRALAGYLGEYHPAVVHGGVPPEDGASAGAITREQELDRFRHDEDCHVLLANPAACGEGVSLHHWCHHAVYLDRTFNAGHFLQSQDRIHRLGLEVGVTTRYTLLLSENSIDEAVNDRLREKIIALATLMDDPGLVQVALPEPDVSNSDQPAFVDDMQAVLAHVDSAKPHAD